MKQVSVLLTALVLLATAPIATAQGTASVDGTVLDASQAAVPAAEVTLTNLDTGAVRTAPASAQGYFNFTDLNPGRYSIKVSSSGFKTWQQDEFVLAVDQHATLRPLLQIGATNQTIEVTAAVPLVTTSDSSISSVVDAKRIEQLPLNGRNALQLVSLAPGVISTGTSGQFGATQLTFSSGGGRDIDVNFSLDGGFNMNQFFGTPNEYPNPDALEQFSVASRNYSAEFGRGTSSVSAVTRSGTNEFHGSAFEFLRNSDLDSRPFFSDAVPGFKRNQYGGTIGGPIIHNKLFFFLGYQGTKVRGSPGEQAYTTLSTAERNGDFSGLGKTIIDPTTGLPFPNNQIPSSDIQPQARTFLQNYLPAANEGSNVYSFTLGDKLDQNQVISKVDYYLSQKDRISVRYFFNDVPQVAFASGSGSALDTNWLSNLPTRFQNSTVSYLHTFSPTLLNDAHLTYDRSTFGVAPLINFSLSGLGYPVNTGNALTDFGLTPDSSLSLGGYFGAYPGAPTRDIMATWQVADNLSWTHGIQTINVGMELYHNRVNELQNFYTGGSLDFTGQFTGDAAADFLLGDFDSYEQIGGLTARLHQTLPSFYGQDDIKLTRTITLNVGLRWDIATGYSSEDKQLSTFRPGVQSTLFPNAPTGLLYPGDDGLPNNIVGTRWDNFAPRLGVAWDVFGNGKTAVRAGFGTYYAPFSRGISLNRFTLIQPFTVNVNVYGGNAADIFAGAPYYGVNPFPRPSGSDPNALKSVPFLPTAGESALALPFKTESSNEWSFSIQQALWHAAVLEADYVGSSSSHLTTSFEGNPAIYIPGASSVSNTQQRRLDPEIGPINVIGQALSSNYESLQLMFRQQYSHGISVQSSYTYSKTLGVNGAETEGSNGPRDPFDYRLDYGPLPYDIRNNWITSFLWQPTADVHLSNSVLNAIVKGWGLNGIVTAQSGPPLDLVSGVDNSFSGIGEDTPDVVGNWRISGNRTTAQQLQQWFNTSAFIANAPGTFGALGIGVLRSPGLWNIDTAIQRTFSLHEGLPLEFRASLYNALNHPNFNAPDNNLQSPTFGQITSINPNTAPRVIEFGLRLSF